MKIKDQLNARMHYVDVCVYAMASCCLLPLWRLTVNFFRSVVACCGIIAIVAWHGVCQRNVQKTL